MKLLGIERRIGERRRCRSEPRCAGPFGALLETLSDADFAPTVVGANLTTLAAAFRLDQEPAAVVAFDRELAGAGSGDLDVTDADRERGRAGAIDREGLAAGCRP